MIADGNGIKAHSNNPNDILKKASEVFEEESGDVGNNRLIELISNHFRWEQITFVNPFDQLSVRSCGKVWRLMYCTSGGMEYHNHLMVKESTLEQAGFGLFADKTCFPK